MRRFLGALAMRQRVDPKTNRPIPTDDGRSTWVLTDNLAFETDDGEMVTAPKGMATDLGSIPRRVWSWGFPPDGIGAPAYVIHDALYLSKGTLEFDGWLGRTREQPYSRDEADHILKVALAECGVTTGDREKIFDAVHIGGGSGWGS